jgi:TolB-like protein
MTDRTQAIFLSYASQDAEPARRICEALRQAGIDVWFDQSELRGGDAWDNSIRRQIKECSLFIPVISSHTQEREEGYFRREWNLAVTRTLDMAHDRAFLLPVVIDATTDAEARVPEKFRDVQWTRLPEGETSAAFVGHISRLLAAREPGLKNPQVAMRVPPSSVPPGSSAQPSIDPARPARRNRRIAAIAGAVAAVSAASALLLHRGSLSPTVAATAVPSTFTPPAHSIAVLPFINMSGDPKQDYFSDGLSEELLNSLATVHELQVAARASSFSFKGSSTKIADIARELNVGAILEGSVRKDGNHVRITAELINAVTGFDQWSQTYDRDLKNILSLQTEIATDVTKQLQATLLPGAKATFELGDTQNPAAFDSYLKGEALTGVIGEVDLKERIADYDEAIRLDPMFANAYAKKAIALCTLSGNGHLELYPQAQAAAEKAVALAPDLGRAHSAMAFAYAGQLDFRRALIEHQRALELAPGDSSVLAWSGLGLAQLKHTEGLAAAQRAAELDPLNPTAHYFLSSAYYASHQYQAAAEAAGRAITLRPDLEYHSLQGASYNALGKYEDGLKACLTPPIHLNNYVCQAIAYHKLGRIPEARAALKPLLETGDSAAWQLAEIYAGWGENDTAIKWLQTAVRLRDPGLISFWTSPLMDSLRPDPRVQLIERELNFPD